MKECNDCGMLIIESQDICQHCGSSNLSYFFITFANDGLKKFIVAARNTKLYTTQIDFMENIYYKSWVGSVEDVRVVASNMAVFIRNGNCDKTTLDDMKNLFFIKWKKVLSFFTNMSKGFKIKASNNDLQTILLMVGKGISTRTYTTLDDYLSHGKHTFRRDIENYIADKIVNEMSKSEDQIVKEKILKNQQKKYARKKRRK